MHVIDSEGDVVLVVGTNKSKISVQVSSNVLSIASKVFHCMFSGTFKEAMELAARYVPLISFVIMNRDILACYQFLSIRSLAAR